MKYFKSDINVQSLTRCKFSLFYMPGTIGGAFIVDYLGPKYTMVSLLAWRQGEILGLMILIFADHWVIVASVGRISHERALLPVRVLFFLPISGLTNGAQSHQTHWWIRCECLDEQFWKTNSLFLRLFTASS